MGNGILETRKSYSRNVTISYDTKLGLNTFAKKAKAAKLKDRPEIDFRPKINLSISVFHLIFESCPLVKQLRGEVF